MISQHLQKSNRTHQWGWWGQREKKKKPRPLLEASQGKPNIEAFKLGRFVAHQQSWWHWTGSYWELPGPGALPASSLKPPHPLSNSWRFLFEATSPSGDLPTVHPQQRMLLCCFWKSLSTREALILRAAPSCSRPVSQVSPGGSPQAKIIYKEIFLSFDFS